MAAPTSSQISFGSVTIYQDHVLGVGSYGKVCKAKYGQLPCAAKLLHDTMLESGDPGIHRFAEKFEQECQFLSSIKHPNIVQYLDATRDPQSQRLALIMELMDESLTKFLMRFPCLVPYHIQLNICHDVALALSYLHSNAIIHRDLSSNNVLLIDDGSRAKVTDFGMSKLTDVNPHMTPLTQCPGTTVYMPPEALTTPPRYSSNLDCFSHGVLTIQIITRNFPSPCDAQKRVQGRRYRNQYLFRQVPETERRKKDIDLVQPDHPLLPIALQCLEINDMKRPSSKELCERLAVLKRDESYTRSVEQSQPSILLQRLQEVIAQKDQLFRECHELKKEKRDQQKEIDRNNQALQEKNQMLVEKTQTIEKKNRIIEEKAQIIQRKNEMIEEHILTIEARDRIIEENRQLLERKNRKIEKMTENNQTSRRNFSTIGSKKIKCCMALLLVIVLLSLILLLLLFFLV